MKQLQNKYQYTLYKMIKKKFLISPLLLVPFISFAQTTGKVGIGTTNPQRSLDVEGNMQIRTLNDVSENGKYDKVLVTNSNGLVDYATKDSFAPSGQNNTDKVVLNSIYSNNISYGIFSKTVKCGKFIFAFTEQTNPGGNINANQPDVVMKLAANPGTEVKVYMSMEQTYSIGGTEDGFQFFQGTRTLNEPYQPFIFDTTNYNTFQRFYEANIVDGEENIMTFQYPGDPDLYRLTVYKIAQELKPVGSTTFTKSWDFVTACEKY